MPRFSAKHVLVAVTLIALGLASVRLFLDLGPRTSGPTLVATCGFWFAGGALIGAGIGLPFNKWGRGVAVGLLLQLLLFIFLFFESKP
jgi:hypothetical protein